MDWVSVESIFEKKNGQTLEGVFFQIELGDFSNFLYWGEGGLSLKMDWVSLDPFSEKGKK